MKIFDAGNYDVIVIGAGHAGCEAGLASARLGARTLVLTISLDSVAMMPCNPSIGGTGKGHLVREIDALGGEMGKNADRATLLSKLLNSSKGPAVHSLRAQIDKKKYQHEMKKVLESEPLLHLRQAEVVDILIEDEGTSDKGLDSAASRDCGDNRGLKVRGVVTSTGARFLADRVIIATGTYLGSTVHIGEARLDIGPSALAGSYKLADAMKSKGFQLRRFKTGTPARLYRRSLDLDKMEEQHSDPIPLPFSFSNDALDFKEVPCYMTYTNPRTHQIILDNLDRSGMFTGAIVGTGARYCPSVETKIFRFKDKDRHLIFIEPEGADTEEMYAQGISTSLSEDAQELFMRSIVGLERAQIMRPAYAIEYECIDSQLLRPTLEHIGIKGLYSAGQFNGSSGYEEAAAQGLVAGINAALAFKGEEPFVLSRSESYIGVLIDDMVTIGIDEPYRMMTSKAEYRLVLRQDNADLRLTEKGHAIGLVSDEDYARFCKYRDELNQELERIKTAKIKEEDLFELFEAQGMQPPKQSYHVAELLKIGNIKYDDLDALDETRPAGLSRRIKTQIEIQSRYGGYIEKQERQIEEFASAEAKKIPHDIDYAALKGLRIEAREKLQKVMPASIGQASRIPGVSPADIAVLMVYLKTGRK